MALGLKRQKKPPPPLRLLKDGEAPPVVPAAAAKERESGAIKRKLIAYHKIGELFQGNGDNPQALMREFLNLTVNVLNAAGGSIWTFDRARSALVCQSATGPDAKAIQGLSVPVDKGVVGWVAEKKRGTLIRDTSKDPRCEGGKVQSLLASPLLYRGELLGVVEVVDRQEGQPEFSQSDLSFLTSLCVPAAQHIHTASLLEGQGRLIQRLGALKDLQEAFSTTMDLERLLDLVMTRTIELMRAEAGSIWLVEESGEGIQCLVAHGPTKDKVVGAKVKRDAGIVGWVVANAKPSLVEDCAKDERFSAALDKRGGFVTRSMVAAPLSVKGECIGAVQIINKKDSVDLFDDSDLQYLLLIAANAAMYIKNARLFSAEKKAKELSALLKMSQEITSTLDLDAVLMSIVNLSSDLIPYDRAVISTVRRGTTGEMQVRAVSGQQKVDEQTEGVSLNAVHNACATMPAEISVMSRAELEAKSDLPEVLKNYLVNRGLESYWACVLKDDQGTLGVLSMEAKTAQMIPPSRREMLSILINQCTVALRNADLYSAVPAASLESLRSKILAQLMRVRTWSWRKQALIGGAFTGLVGALIFVKVPHTVSANLELVPIAETYYAESQGKVKEVLVKEGQKVDAGQVLAKLDVGDLVIQRNEKAAARLKAYSEMVRLTSEDKIADAAIKSAELKSLDFELERLTSQITKAEIRAGGPGTVLSEKLSELAGKPVTYGQEVIKLSRLDKLVAEFKVHEDDVVFVEPGQTLKFKVFGLPQKTFSDGLKLDSVAGEGRPTSQSDPTKYFIARAEVANTDDAILRPGMTGRGRIAGEPQALWYVLLEQPLRFLINRILF